MKHGFCALILLVVLHASSHPASAALVRLRSGDTLNATVLRNTEEGLLVQHPDLGELFIAADRLAPPEPEAEPPTTADRVAPGTPAEPQDSPETKTAPGSGAGDPSLQPGWKRRIVFGGTASKDDDGDKTKLNFRGRLERLREDRETRVFGSWIYGKDNGEIDDNFATVRGEQIWLSMKNPSFVFVNAQFDYNEFRDWRERALSHAGLGYRIKSTEKFDLRARAGAGARKDFGSEDEDLLGEGLLGVDLRWDPFSRHTFETQLRYFPGIDNDRSRFTASTDWSYLLDREINLSFNVSWDYEYDTDPDAGFPNDVYYLTFGLQLDF